MFAKLQLLDHVNGALLAADPIRSMQAEPGPIMLGQKLHGLKEQVETLVLRIKPADPEDIPTGAAVPGDAFGKGHAVGGLDGWAGIAQFIKMCPLGIEEDVNRGGASNQPALKQPPPHLL